MQNKIVGCSELARNTERLFLSFSAMQEEKRARMSFLTKLFLINC